MIYLEWPDLLGAPVKGHHLTVKHSRRDTLPQQLRQYSHDIWKLGCVIFCISTAPSENTVTTLLSIWIPQSTAGDKALARGPEDFVNLGAHNYAWYPDAELPQD